MNKISARVQPTSSQNKRPALDVLGNVPKKIRSPNSRIRSPEFVKSDGTPILEINYFLFERISVIVFLKILLLN